MSQDQPIPSPVSLGIDGGLNLKTDPQRLQPPAVTRADNVWHVQPGNVQQLPGFVTQLAQAASFSHVYNLATRDLSPPAPTGDLLVHGEYPDNIVAGFTRSLWATTNGTNVTQNQSSLPFTARLRPIAGSLQMSGAPSSIDGNTQNLYTSQLCTARENLNANSRYATGYLAGVSSGSSSFYITTGVISSTTKTGSLQIDATSANAWYAYDMGEIQGQNRFIVTYLTNSSANAFYRVYDFSLNVVAGETSIGAATGSPALPVNVTQHAGRTLISYISSAAGFYPVVRDWQSGNVYTLTAVTSSTAPANFSIASPYSHQANSGVVYAAMVYDRKLFVLARQSSGVLNVVAQLTLPQPTGNITTGVINPAVTIAVNILDNQGGVDAGAKLGITIFQHGYQQTSLSPSSRTLTAQHVYASNYVFTSAATNPLTTAGSVASQGHFICRSFGGTGIAGKAFCMTPAEAQFAGPANAKQALCLIQTSAVEPEVNATYVPTMATSETICRDVPSSYLLINHRCEIVGRFAEGIACPRPANFCWAGTGASATAAYTFPILKTLATPLMTNGTPDDTSLYSIGIPSWTLAIASPAVLFTDSSGTPYATAALVNWTAIPTLITLTMDRNAQSCAAISTSAHVYVNGLLGQIHDGDNLMEQGYHQRPPSPIVSSVTYATLTSAKAGYYRLYTVWTWVDAQGFTHRSTPSLFSTITQADGQVISNVTMFLGRPNTQKRVLAEVYISSVANSDNAVLLGSMIINNLAQETYDFNQTAGYSPYATAVMAYSVTNTPSNKAMYTQPNATATASTYTSQPPRSSFHQISGKGRAFALAQITGQHRVYYSSIANQSFPFEWNDLNFAGVPPEIGDARSLEIIDDKVIVLGTRGNAAMSGDGPPAASVGGAPAPNDGFSPVTPIPTPAGVLGTGSPARVPEGLVFTGYSGIQLVGRDLNIQPIGMPVDALTGRQIGVPGTVYGRAVTLPSLQSVVYPNPRGPALVYSYLTKRWSTWPLLSNCLTLAQRMDGTVYAAIQPIGVRQLLSVAGGADIGTLSSASYAYNVGTSTAAALVVETPWVAIGGVTGCEADLYEAEVIGTWYGPHTLLIEQAYNYRDYVLPQTTDMSVSPGEYMVRVRPLQNTRVWAVRYRISLLPLTTLNAGYPMAGLSDLVVYSSVQGGTAQVDSARTR